MTEQMAKPCIRYEVFMAVNIRILVFCIVIKYIIIVNLTAMPVTTVKQNLEYDGRQTEQL
jgi:hypothetical protein